MERTLPRTGIGSSLGRDNANVKVTDAMAVPGGLLVLLVVQVSVVVGAPLSAGRGIAGVSRESLWQRSRGHVIVVINVFR